MTEQPKGAIVISRSKLDEKILTVELVYEGLHVTIFEGTVRPGDALSIFGIDIQGKLRDRMHRIN